MKFLKIILALVSPLSHIFPLTLLFLAFKPVALWYLAKIPVLGVDFFNSVGYVSYLAKNLPLPVNAFKDFWFGGYPLFREFVSLHWWAMIPFYNKFGPVLGIQIYVMATLFLFGCASYFLFFQLSKSRALSAILAFLVLYSVNIYGAATWGGSLPFFSTQLFLPLVLGLLDKYIVSGSSRWFLTAILVSGFGFMGHPLPMFAFTIPTSAILLFFGLRKTTGKIFGELISRLRIVTIFAFGSLLVSLPVSYERLYFTINSLIRGGFSVLLAFIAPPGGGAGGSSAGPAASVDILNFYRSLTRLLYTDTNVWIFYLAAAGAVLFLVVLILKRKISLIFRVLPYVLIVGWGVLHTFANAYGIGFFPQGWYREFWAFPVLLGALVAVFWGQFFDLIRDKLNFKNIVVRLVAINLPFIALTLLFFIIGYLFFTTKSQSIIMTIDTKSEISSAHPQALSIRTSKADLEETKKRLLPEFIDPSDKNKRLYEADALVNIWWNSLYDLPLARGYVDPPIGNNQKGGFFWLDIAIANDTIVRDFNVPEEIAFNNALFLIDWYGIYYYEGGRVAVSASVGPSSYLVNNNVFDKNEQTTVYGALIKWQTPSGKPELNLEIPQYLNFYKVRDELTSPVVYTNNAPAILVFSDFGGYEDFLRGIAASNINSKYLIPVNAGRFIDDWQSEDLSRFEAIFLSNYDYRSKDKAFDLLAKFAKNGGKIFIDTGAESRESKSKELPEVFPINSSNREGYGKNWEFEVADDPISKDIKFADFGPLVFNDSEWKLASTDEAVRSDAKVILGHRGKPVIVRYPFGRGEIIWSGMNLLYHMNQYQSVAEMRFFTNIVQELAPISLSAVGKTEVIWKKPEKIIVKSPEGAGGILVKEEAYAGWKAHLRQGSGGQARLPIYKVGPTYPGFIYIPLKDAGPIELEIKYSGEIAAYFYYGLSIILILFLLDKAIFNGFFIVKRTSFFSNRISQKLGGWWEKEED